MPDAVKITYVNHSTYPNPPKAFLFMQNEVSSFDPLRDAVAWRVVEDVDRESSATFTFSYETMVSASWNGGSCCTPMIPAEAGKRYAVLEDETGITIGDDGSASRNCSIEVANTVHVPNGISVNLYKDGKLMLTKNTVAYDQKATFVLHPKLYWGLADHIQEGQPLGSAVLMSDSFFELNLEGLTEVTVGLYGNPEAGYEFKVDRCLFQMVPPNCPPMPKAICSYAGRAIKITCTNHSIHQYPPRIFLFMQNDVPAFDPMKDAVAWRVVTDLGRLSSAIFTFSHDTMVSASWNGGSCCTPMISAEAGKRYAVLEDETGITIGDDGSADRRYAIEVANTVHVPNGISVNLYKDGKLMLTKNTVAYDQKATFVLHPKLYWGLADHIQEGQPLGSAVLDSDSFFELNLEGVTEVTVGLYGNPEDGYEFKVDSIK